MKDSAIVNTNFMKAVDKLPVEKQGAAYRAYIMYATAGEEYTGDDIAIAALLEAFRSYIDENREKYEAKATRAKKAAEKRAEQNRNDIDTKSEQNRNDIDSVSVSVSVSKEKDTNVSQKKSSAFRRPTVDEVKAYCLERRNDVDPQRFVDFYEAKGWKVGKDAMKDWKACVRTWEKRNRGDPPKNAGITRGTDSDALLAARMRGG